MVVLKPAYQIPEAQESLGNLENSSVAPSLLTDEKPGLDPRTTEQKLEIQHKWVTLVTNVSECQVLN